MKFSRIIADIVLFITIFLLPWWAAALLALVLVFYFHDFYEVLFVGLLLDSIHSVANYVFGLPFTLSAALVFVVSYSLKKRLTFYDSW